MWRHIILRIVRKLFKKQVNLNTLSILSLLAIGLALTGQINYELHP